MIRSKEIKIKRREADFITQYNYQIFQYIPFFIILLLPVENGYEKHDI